ncbi:hypothetical protein PTTG_00969 [Puccinia triticina 1-1 BBBD Race 1]|uniref:Uncharacterized protein n=1 Tax=Puccinia triticina (isolate 1-1 / race 1 (BBBD)) TaxID=630390 RepID=A0A0C4EJP8_PUCT1|nr:hypothetical protein PTTG_00969 [Puccinia triticina 1-1 BBBD Race 1]
MQNPKTSEDSQKLVTEAKEALAAEFGTPEEQTAAQRNQARKNLNPQAETSTALQKMVATLYRVCNEHAEGATEGVTFVNPKNPTVFMEMGHNRLRVWAQAILDGTPGVDVTHPPNSPRFQWKPIKANSVLPVQISSPVSSTSIRSTTTVNHATLEIPNEVQPTPGAFDHFNNDTSPLTLTGIKRQGLMAAFLTSAMIPPNDHHTRMLIQKNCIHHWTYFCRSTMRELLGMGFAPGPARLSVDGLPIYIQFLHSLSQNDAYELPLSLNSNM